MRNTADLESTGENLSALEPFQGPEMDKGYLEDLTIMTVSTDRRGIDRKRWRATRRTVLERDQYRCRKDELAGLRPPHSCERLTAFVDNSGHPDGAGYVTSFGPSLVHVSGSVPRLAPAAPPCTNVNTPLATQSGHVFCTASPANVNGIAGPGAFYLPRALFVAADGAGALAV